uniref:Uncharacterized protein n=1 Tax=Arundo donax TaxID=35708 RepID=A0A0A9E8U2_ARUDO
MSDQSTLAEEVQDRIPSSPTDLKDQNDMLISGSGSTSKYHADEDKESSPMISRSAILRKSCMRSKRFLWTYESFFVVVVLFSCLSLCVGSYEFYL